jgi:hypothetical protein
MVVTVTAASQRLPPRPGLGPAVPPQLVEHDHTQLLVF